MAEIIVVHWRDIPAQVIAGQGRRAVRAELSARFAEAIDRAAMRSGAHGTDAYLEGWRRVAVTVDDGDAAAIVASAAAALEADWDDARLARLVAAGGHAS